MTQEGGRRSCSLPEWWDETSARRGFATLVRLLAVWLGMCVSGRWVNRPVDLLFKGAGE